MHPVYRRLSFIAFDNFVKSVEKSLWIANSSTINLHKRDSCFRKVKLPHYLIEWFYIFTNWNFNHSESQSYTKCLRQSNAITSSFSYLFFSRRTALSLQQRNTILVRICYFATSVLMVVKPKFDFTNSLLSTFSLVLSLFSTKSSFLTIKGHC